MSGSPLVLPPVHLLPADALARLALASPLLDRALRLTRWAGQERRVDGAGELLDDELRAAAEELGLSGDFALAQAAQAWGVALDTGLLALDLDAEAGDAGDAEEAATPGEPAGRAVPGEVSGRLGAAGGPDLAGDPYDLLDVWLGSVESTLAEAALPEYDEVAGEQDGDGEPIAGDAPGGEEDAAELLDAALVNLYALSALEADGAPRPGDGAGPAQDRPGEEAGGADAGYAAVPLPVLAASLVVPEEMEQPSEAVLEEVTSVMLRLDDDFRLLAATGLLEYTPMDEALIEESDDEPGGEDGEEPGGAGEFGEDAISRYGEVRLTALGVYGMRERLIDAGAHAPVLGDLADAPADDLLDALAGYPDHAARAEAEAWAAGRKPAEAARELLAAAVDAGAEGPVRRMVCQQVLLLLGPEAEPAVREVLDDLRLGGLARAWLTERQAPDIPAPAPEMVLWFTVDTVAAQLSVDEESEHLAELVVDLLARHEGFLAEAWRVDHPATAAVLEAVGRFHPDRGTAKEARKAAFKARSRPKS